jgi:hypothetical protein
VVDVEDVVEVVDVLELVVEDGADDEGAAG